LSALFDIFLPVILPFSTRASVPFEDGRGHHDLRLLAVARHQVAADEEVEELVGAAELDVVLQRDRVVGLEQRVEELVHVDRPLLLEALGEIVALQHARHGVLRAQLDHARGAELVEPLGVVANQGRVGVEHLEGLLLVGARGLHHLVAGEARAQIVLPGRVADHRGEVADDEDHRVPEAPGTAASSASARCGRGAGRAASDRSRP
jgi:hypothetical protein